MPTYEIPGADIIAWRRHLHAHPELSYQEFQTAAFVEERLRAFGLETSRPTETSVVGILRGTLGAGPHAGPTVALRADLDALPVHEETGEPFASTVPGVMHACGHDTHTAMLLGTASTLAGLRDQLCGTVKFLFQHAEEQNPGGARSMVEAGVLDDVDSVFGFHVMRGPLGTVCATKGDATSSAGGFFVTIQGRGSHGSMPHRGVDPLLCGAQVVLSLNHIVSRSIDPTHAVVVNAGVMHSGDAPNVMPDTARIGCSIRTTSQDDADIAYRRAEEVVRGICLAYGCTYTLDWVEPYDIVRNDPDLVDVALAAATRVLGAGHAYECPPMSGSEDFSAFTNVRPGAFVIINAGDDDDGLLYENHHPKFNVVESALLDGTRTQVEIVLDVLRPDLARRSG